jgi:hypothetical protein
VVGDIRPFDPFPCPFLTMTVSLEAIFLALFVLASRTACRGRPTNAATSTCKSTCSRARDDGCAPVLQDIADHLRVETSVMPEQLRDLMKKTDLKRLTNRMEELAEPAGASSSTKSDAEAESPRAAAS